MEFVLGAGSLVLVAGGITALVRGSMGRRQALSVLAIAAAVVAVALLTSSLAEARGLGSVYVGLMIASMTLAGMLAAVAVILRPPPRL